MRAALQQLLPGNGRRWAPLLAGLWALSAAAAVTQSDLSETRAELDELRSRIQKVQARIEADRADRSEAESRIEALDREIAGLAADRRQTKRALSDTRADIARLNDRSRDLRASLSAHKERIARLAYSAYVMGRQSQLKLFLNQTDPAVINRMLGYHDYVVAARARTIEEITGWADEIAALSSEKQARQTELEALESEYRAEHDALQARRRDREAALATVKARIASAQSELARLEENESQLQRLLGELKEHLAAQDSRATAEGAFRRMKGKLRLPVSAPIAVRFGQPRATGVRWDGIMFRPENGSEVRAIFEGRVVYSDWLRGFGLLLIVDHGDGFMSLYSHNESLFKDIGDWVETDEAIATVGTSGGLDRPGLYFEIRHDGEPQNPLAWCQKA